MIEAKPPVNARILVVDDDYTTRRIFVRFLKDAGYEVQAFTTPEEIGDQIKECEIILMDIRFGRDRPTAGIDYIVERIQEGSLDPNDITIIFKTMWGRRDHPGFSTRLENVARYEWFDTSEGLELTELTQILKKREIG